MADKKYKQIQAGQDWSDPDTWYGLIVVVLMVAGFLSLAYYHRGPAWM
tara:strand:+ start:2709 stop:2852 length:144 start_codon:yes stop_codon:yes gene_type:complete